MKIIAIGELLWDVIGDAEHIGGAPFNFSAHAARLGHEVIFISAVGDDERGKRARMIAAELGLPARFIQTAAQAPTGIVSVQLDETGQPHFTIHRPAAYDGVSLADSDLQYLAALQPEWVYYGTLHQAQPGPRQITARLLAACPSARRFYDVNLRRDSYTPELVLELLEGASVVKLNEDELRATMQMLGSAARTIEDFCRECAQSYGWQAICVTRAEKGCALLVGSEYAEAPAYPTQVVDAVGAGDAFAAAFIHGLQNAWPAARIADFANRLASLVAGRSGAVPAWTLEECARLNR